LSWAGFAAGVLAFLTRLFDLLNAKRLRQEGASAQMIVQQEQVIDEVATAHEARIGVERDLALHPERLREDDGFRRPD
jgi:hypothetical protein